MLNLLKCPAIKLAAASLGIAMLVSQPAAAACYELVGCTDNQNMPTSGLNQLSCDSLWLVRNTIFDENGYCFQTARGNAMFSNAGCLYTTSAATPLNHYEQANVDKVRAVEREKGCQAQALAASPLILVPVMVGGETDFDACGANGEVTGLNPKGDNFLSVRAGPSSKHAELDRLGPLSHVYVCDENDGWWGVVYGEGTCGVTSPVSRRKAYDDGCRSGWVFKRYITITAE